jgi:hypothetical protein
MGQLGARFSVAVDPTVAFDDRAGFPAEASRKRAPVKPKAAPKPKRAANPAPAPSSNGNGAPSADVFRVFRQELEALGTAETIAELERRRETRARKRAEGVAA